MALQDMLRDTKQFGENLLIAEFENGRAVAYEKRTEENQLVYGIVPETASGGICGWYLTGEKNFGSINNFSGAAQQAIASYNAERQTRQKRVGEELTQLYQDITASLKIREGKDRKLGLLLGSFLTTATYPLSVPIIMTYLHQQHEAHVKEYQKIHGEGKAPHSEAMPELLILGAPLVFAHAIQNALSLPHHEKYYKVTNKRALNKEDNNRKRAAVLFSSLDEQCKTWASWLSGFGHPADGSPSRSTNPPSLLFADGKEIHKGGFAFMRPFEGTYGVEEEFKKTQYFLDVDPNLEKKLDQLMRQEREEFNIGMDFEEELRKNKEEQLAMLKLLGFAKK